MVMMNFYGYVTSDRGRASRCILKTFEEAGYQVDLLATPGNEANRNLIFLAAPEKKDFSGINYSEPNSRKIEDITKYFVYKSTLDMNDAIVLTDDCPALEKIYLPAALDWRRSSINYNLKRLMEQNVQLVK